jgi:hypothetical protein
LPRTTNQHAAGFGNADGSANTHVVTKPNIFSNGNRSPYCNSGSYGNPNSNPNLAAGAPFAARNLA